jgi:homoaconitase/3-isopropylmalate dehydratase large subunit
VDGAIYKALEFAGETVKNMSVSERITLSNMAIECGAKVGLIGSDDKTTVYLKKRTDETGDAIAANNGCYDRVMEFEVENLVPQVACPHDLDNLCPIDKVEDIGIHEVFIGTCTNGRYEDLKVAADILKGHKVSRFTRTIIIPASVSIYQEAMQSGIIKTFQDAGCIVCNPGCGPCIGRSQGTLAPGERALTTMNRNFRGRMGSPDSEIYIASPATCAASAIEGKIADPRKYL